MRCRTRKIPVIEPRRYIHQVSNLDVHTFIVSTEGGAGNDKLTVNSSGCIHGATLRGGSGNDTFTGANGDDVLYGDTGFDVLRGLAGDNVLVGNEGSRDTLDGGSGFDLADDQTVDVRISIEGRP